MSDLFLRLDWASARGRDQQSLIEDEFRAERASSLGMAGRRLERALASGPHDDALDEDADGVPDGCDQCPNANDADDADLDLYVEGREQLDFTTSYDFGNGVELFGEAKNLTDSAGVRYYGSRERTYEYEKFGYNVFFGVRFKL